MIQKRFLLLLALAAIALFFLISTNQQRSPVSTESKRDSSQEAKRRVAETGGSKESMPPLLFDRSDEMSGNSDSSSAGSDSQTKRSESMTSDPPPENAFDDEIVLTFRTAKELEDFLASFDRESATLIHRIPELHAARIQFTSPDARSEIIQRANQNNGTPSYNFPVFTPPEPRDELLVGSQPFGEHLFPLLGIEEDNRSWGKNTRIAVLDSAVIRHQSFGAARLSISSVFESISPDPPVHGTAITSTIIANDRVLRGIAPSSEIIAIEVLDSSGQGDAFTVASGVFEAIERGADIINLSLGTPSDAPILRQAIQQAVDAKILVVAAAGNERSGIVPYPARYDDVIAVTATDALSRIAPFSNTSSAIDISAPGVGVYVAVGESQYAAMSGTSIATPIVSATLAAVLSLDPKLSSKNLQKILFENSNDLGLPGEDASYGKGVLHVGRIMRRKKAGIRDVAISDHILDKSRITESEVPLLITIENRGTASIASLTLRYKVDGKAQQTVLKDLEPRALRVVEVPIGRVPLGRSEGVKIESEVELGGDVSPNDNSRTSRLRIAR